jgi:hypothetical protein
MGKLPIPHVVEKFDPRCFHKSKIFIINSLCCGKTRPTAKHAPTDYFTVDEYEYIIDVTYRLGEDGERSWAPEKHGIRIPGADGY